MTANLDGLTGKQAAFVREYVVDHNATQAAIRAGYSEKTSYSIGSENLRKPEIARAITEEEKTLADRLGITRHFILSGYLRVFEVAMSLTRPDLAQANRALENLATVVPELGLPTAGMSHVDQELMRAMEEWTRSEEGQQVEGELRELVAEMEDRIRRTGDLDERERELRRREQAAGG